MLPPPPCVSFIEYVLLALEHPPNMFVSKLAACCTMLFLERSDPELLSQLCLKWVIRFNRDRYKIISRIRESTRGSRCAEMYSRPSTDSVLDMLESSRECDPNSCVEHFLQLINTFVPEYFSWNWHHTAELIQTNKESGAYVREKLLPQCIDTDANADNVDDEEAGDFFPYSGAVMDTDWYCKQNGAKRHSTRAAGSPTGGCGYGITFATVSNLHNRLCQSPNGLVLIFHANYSSNSCEALTTFENILREQLLNPIPQVCIVHAVAEPELANFYQILWFPTIIFIPPLVDDKGGGPSQEKKQLGHIIAENSFDEMSRSGTWGNSNRQLGDSVNKSYDTCLSTLATEPFENDGPSGSPLCARIPLLYDEKLTRFMKQCEHRVYPPNGDLSAASLVRWINSKGSVVPVKSVDDGVVSRINLLSKERTFLKRTEYRSSMDSLQKLTCSTGGVEVGTSSAEAPLFIFLGGGMAAGKSTAVSALSSSIWWKNHKANSVIINADVFKHSIDSESSTPESVHLQSTRLAEELMVKAVNEGRSIVFDSTMMWRPFVEQVIDMVRNAHHSLYAQGVGYSEDGRVEEYFRPIGPRKKPLPQPYTIRLLAITVEPEVAVRRGILRKFSTGRGVPIQTQLRSFRLFAENFSGYVALVDEATLYNNNVLVDLSKGELPPVLAEKRNGKLEVNDEDAYALFTRQQRLNENAANALQLHTGTTGS